MHIHDHGAQDMASFNWKHLPTVFSMFVFAFAAHGACALSQTLACWSALLLLLLMLLMIAA